MFWNNGITKSNDSRMFLLVTVMLSAMILPSFPLHPSLPNIRLDELLVFGVFGINFLLFALHGFRFSEQEKTELLRQKKELKIVFIIFGFLVLSYFISNIYGVYIRGAGYYGLRDVMELVTYLKYFLVLTLVLAIEVGKEELDFLAKAFVGGLIFLIVFGWGQHWNLLNMNSWLSPFFDQNHWELLFSGNPVRVQGTFDNPNYFGILTVICLSYLTVRYFFGEHKGKFPWLNFILIGLIIKLEILTISRTAFFCIALLFTILCAWAFFYHTRRRKVVIKIISLFLLTLVLFFTASADFFYRLNEGLDFSSSTSFLGHINRWGEAIGTIWESPVFGWGTQKYVMTTLVDNEYALYARRYGFVGLAVYLSFFLVPFIMGIRKLRAETRLLGKGRTLEHHSQFIASYIAVLPSIFVFNMMAGVFYNLQIMTFFVISIGLVYNSLKYKAALEES